MKSVGIGLALAFCWLLPVFGEVITIETQDELYSMDLPSTLEDANRLNLGLSELLNEVIVLYLKSSDQASADLDRLLSQIDLSKTKLDAASGTVADLQTQDPIVAPVIAPKTLFLGAYGDLNPTALGPWAVGGGATAGISLFDSFVAEGAFGVLFTGSNGVTVMPQLRITVSKWLF